jgi:hypothetical protein
MWIGLAIAVVLTGIIAMKLINKTREGLTNNSDDADKTTTRIQDVVSKLKKETEMLDDTLLLDKHRADYEDLFLALEDYSNLALIQMLAFFANNPSLETESAKTMIEGINQVNTLKTTLNDVMEFMDRKQTTTTAATSSSIKSFFGSS